MDEKKYAYKIFPEKRLIVKYYYGRLSIVDLLAYINKTGLDSKYDPTMSVINDIRDVELTVDEVEMSKAIRYVKEHKGLYGKRNMSFLTSTPIQTVFTNMLDFIKNETLINIQTFSTVKAAMKWLGLSSGDFVMIEDCLDKLKTQPNTD